MELELVISIFTVIVTFASIIAVIYTVIISSTTKKENENLEKYFEKLKKEVGERDNIINLMLENVKELREYYTISKKQAKNSFQIASITCMIGILIYIFGIIMIVIGNKDVTIITVIAGTIVEVISGSSFWLYNQTNKQLNIYHKRLGYTEKYLTVIQIIREIPQEKQYEEYRNLINFILSDNSKSIVNDN